MKQIRQRLTYANVMSTIAVFLLLGGGAAFAASKKINGNRIKAGTIKTGKFAKESVRTGKIALGAVSESRLADGAVTTNKLGDNAVTEPKIADNAVTTNKITDNAVTTGKIANDAVISDKLAANSVTNAKIAANAVTATQLAAGAVGAGKLGTILRVVTESATTTATGETRNVTASCPPNFVAISGGAAWVTTAGGVSTVNGIIRVSQPIPSTAGVGAPTAWQATGETDAAFERRLRAYAICLQVG